MVWPTRPLVYELIARFGERWRFTGSLSDFKPELGYLIKWGTSNDLIGSTQTKWYDHRRRLRNIIAHGQDMVVAPSWSLGTLQQTIVTLNKMFPDPATTAYDDEVRRIQEQRDREWNAEVEEALRAAPAADAQASEGPDAPDEI